MKGARGAQEHSPGGWSGKTALAKMKKMKMMKNEWHSPGPRPAWLLVGCAAQVPQKLRKHLFR